MLVSVIVVTYNSGKFINEALESVFKQTWINLELIITDDCSQDRTVEFCYNWLNINRNRFISSTIITSVSNTGVPANANRGLAVANGDWICFLAGDDALKPDCIKNNMDWIATHPKVKVLLSPSDVYNNTFEPQNLLYTIPSHPINSLSIMALRRSAESQYKMLLTSDRINFTPSVFINRETINKVGGYDERFRMLEDYPLWLNLTKNGFKLNFMDKVTVRYRMHDQAINNKGSNYIINPNYFKQEHFRKIYTYPNLPTDIMLSKRFEWYISQIFRCNKLNKQTKLNKVFYSFLTTYLNPFTYFIWLKKQIINSLKHNEFYM